MGQMAMAGNPTTGLSLNVAMVGHVSGALDGPFVVLLEKDSANEPDNGVIVGKDADDLGSALISPLSRSRPLVDWIFGQWSGGKLL